MKATTRFAPEKASSRIVGASAVFRHGSSVREAQGSQRKAETHIGRGVFDAYSGIERVPEPSRLFTFGQNTQTPAVLQDQTVERVERRKLL